MTEGHASVQKENWGKQQAQIYHKFNCKPRYRQPNNLAVRKTITVYVGRMKYKKPFNIFSYAKHKDEKQKTVIIMRMIKIMCNERRKNLNFQINIIMFNKRRENSNNVRELRKCSYFIRYNILPE